MNTPRTAARVYAHDMRPCAVFVPEGKARGSIAVERIEVVRYSDTTLYDRMHARAQLSDRQHQAAEKLAGIWVAAGLEPTVCADFGVRVSERSGEAGSDDDLGAVDTYRRLLRAMSTPMAMALDALMLGQHPAVAGLERVQNALDRLADEWGMER